MRLSVATFAALLLVTSCGGDDVPARFCYGDGLCVEADGNLVDREGNTACNATGTCGDTRQPGDTGAGDAAGDAAVPTDDCKLCSPTASDTDGDCIDDATEDAYEAEVSTTRDVPPYATATPCAGLDMKNNADSDGDGVLDGCENRNWDGSRQAYEMDACVSDTDFDGILDGIEDENGNGRPDPGESHAVRTDSDFDGLPDGVEDADQDGIVDPWVDTDGDGCYTAGTDTPGESDPGSLDSDHDGIADNVEDANANGQCDPGETCLWVTDTDCDGLRDGNEDKNGNGVLNTAETDPLDPDTDNDGLSDGTEDWNGNGAWDVGSETSPLRADSDGDGINDGAEDIDLDGQVDDWIDRCDPPTTCWILCAADNDTCKNACIADCNADTPYCAWSSAVGECQPTAEGGIDGVYDPGIDIPGESDPKLFDTDGDGIGDGNEDRNHNGMCDSGLAEYISPQGRTVLCPGGTECPTAVTCDAGVCRVETYLESCAFLFDTDGDGINDGFEDVNRDGQNSYGETDPTRRDSDFDGLMDGCPAWLTDQSRCEDKNNDGSVDAGETNPLTRDTDGDGLVDGCEVNFDGCDTPGCGTDPLAEDTDADDYADGEEDSDRDCVYEPADGETDPRVFDDPPPPGTIDFAELQVCGTQNLKQLTYADSSRVTHDYRLALEKEPDGGGIELPYFVDAFGADLNGGNFDGDDPGDALWGHAFQSPEEIEDPIYGPLNRDIYGFVLATTTATDQGLDSIFDIRVTPAAQAAFAALGALSQQTDVPARPAHDSIIHNDPQFTDFPINRAQRTYELSIPATADRDSVFEIRNQLLHALVNEFDPGAVAPTELPDGLPNRDRIHGPIGCPTAAGLCHSNFSVYIGAVRRGEYIPGASLGQLVTLNNNRLVEDPDGQPAVLFVVAITQNDSNIDATARRRWEDRLTRLEDLTGGSHLARFAADVSKTCENKPTRKALADMLWVVDDSASMQSVIGRLQQAANDIRNVLEANREIVDFRVAMTTTNPSVGARDRCFNECDETCGGGGRCDTFCADQTLGCLKICPTTCTPSGCSGGVCDCACSGSDECSSGNTCLDPAVFGDSILADANLTSWLSPVPNAGTGYPMPGGGGTFYFEDNEYLDCLSATGSIAVQQQDRFFNTCSTTLTDFFASGREQLLANAGFLGSDPSATCDAATMDLLYDVTANIPDACLDDPARFCERLTEECTDGPRVLTSQMCDLVRSMGGLPCELGLGLTTGSRPHSAAEIGTRSARRLLSKMIPAWPSDYDEGDAAERRLHLRLNCAQAGSGRMCPSGQNLECDDHETCDAITTTGTCTVEGDCADDEFCDAGSCARHECVPTGNCLTCDPRSPSLGVSGQSCTTVEDPDNLPEIPECPWGEFCDGSDCRAICEPVPLVTIMLSDEEDFYFKDECVVGRGRPAGDPIWELFAGRSTDLSQLPELCHWTDGDPAVVVAECGLLGNEDDCGSDSRCRWDGACQAALSGQPCTVAHCQAQGYLTGWPSGYDPDLAAQLEYTTEMVLSAATNPTIAWRDAGAAECSTDFTDRAATCVGNPCIGINTQPECDAWAADGWCQWTGTTCINRCAAYTITDAQNQGEWDTQRSSCVSDPYCRWDQSKVRVGDQTEACILEVQPNDCQACKRLARTVEALDGTDGLVGFRDVGPVYAIVREKGTQGFVESNFAGELGQDDCGGGGATWGRGDGQAYRDLAIGTFGRTQNVCTTSEAECAAADTANLCRGTPGCQWNTGQSACSAVGYQSFLGLIVTDIAALSAPYPLEGAPIAATIKVGLARPLPGCKLLDESTCNGDNDLDSDGDDDCFWNVDEARCEGFEYTEVPRSRTSGFFFNPTTNSIGFKSDPIDGVCCADDIDPTCGGQCAADGAIEQSEIDYASQAKHVPKSEDLVFISYRLWLPVPCQERCGDGQSCVRLFCPDESSLLTCTDDSDCVIGEVCVATECQLDCTPGESVEICTCGTACPACQLCNFDSGECELFTTDPCECDPRHETCQAQPSEADCLALASDPGGRAYCSWDASVDECGLSQRCEPGTVNTCGPGFVCDESCVCVIANDCLDGFNPDGTVKDCTEAVDCCNEWAFAAVFCPTLLDPTACNSRPPSDHCYWEPAAGGGAGGCVATAGPCCAPLTPCPAGNGDCNPSQTCGATTPATCEPPLEIPECFSDPETGLQAIYCAVEAFCDCGDGPGNACATDADCNTRDPAGCASLDATACAATNGCNWTGTCEPDWQTCDTSVGRCSPACHQVREYCDETPPCDCSPVPP